MEESFSCTLSPCRWPLLYESCQFISVLKQEGQYKLGVTPAQRAVFDFFDRFFLMKGSDWYLLLSSFKALSFFYIVIHTH